MRGLSCSESGSMAGRMMAEETGQVSDAGAPAQRLKPAGASGLGPGRIVPRFGPG